jgi:hypothetical protein
MEKEWGASAMSACIARENNMKSAQKTSKAKATLSRVRDVFIDWLYGTFLLMGIGSLIMIGSVAIASSTNALRMSGYLDVVFGLQAFISVYILIWIPAAALVYYNKQE